MSLNDIESAYCQASKFQHKEAPNAHKPRLSYCYAIILFFNNAIQLNDRLEGQFEIIQHTNMRRSNERIGDIGKCGSNWQDQIRDHPFMTPTRRGEGSGSGGRMWTGGGGPAPCGRPHRKLILESTDGILSSSHAKKLASFLPVFVFGQK